MRKDAIALGFSCETAPGTTGDDIEPGNHPITIAIKGSSGTLRDTGRLAQSISGKIEGLVSISA